MWLLNVSSYELQDFLTPESSPAYAILSHTWGDDEVSFQDIKSLGQARLKKGFRKIEYCCRQAILDGLTWAWVDTCCIDKTSSAELSEAINSMFAWYASSAICYAYLEDVHSVADLKPGLTGSGDVQTPRWFTRGWTLQELIAPSYVAFYSAGWQLLGSRSEHQAIIADLTGITTDILDGTLTLDEIPVATRMSWAAQRMTTRKEDEAYCLLGIFDVNMPLLYGEGGKAFQRLLGEILERIEDQTIFLCKDNWLLDQSSSHIVLAERGFLARSTRDFMNCTKFRPADAAFDPDAKVDKRHPGVQMKARMKKLSEWRGRDLIPASIKSLAHSDSEFWLLALNCSVSPSNSDAQHSTYTSDAEPEVTKGIT